MKSIPANQAGILNAQRVIDDLRGDIQGYREMVEVCLDYLSSLHEQIAGAHEREALLTLIHEAANSCGVVGADAAAQTIRTAEIQFHNREPGASAEQSARVTQEELKRVCATLESWLVNHRTAVQ